MSQSSNMQIAPSRTTPDNRPTPPGPALPQAISDLEPGEVATHVLVPAEQAEKLRELSRKTRINQSDYLREAVDDLLLKYARRGGEE